MPVPGSALCNLAFHHHPDMPIDGRLYPVLPNTAFFGESTQNAEITACVQDMRALDDRYRLSGLELLLHHYFAALSISGAGRPGDKPADRKPRRARQRNELGLPRRANVAGAFKAGSKCRCSFSHPAWPELAVARLLPLILRCRGFGEARDQITGLLGRLAPA
jgi:hypothetical protein